MKATAQAPSNIAFIKYWGKADDTARLPLNSSISMNLSGTYTITTVDFSPEYNNDIVELLDGTFSEKEKSRVINYLDTIRAKACVHEKAKVVTRNTFPKGTGAAASASGFAALTVAGFASLSMNLSEKELTIFARMGSGSACRSIPDGFVLWEKGMSSEDSFAYTLFSHDYWDLCDALVIVNLEMKKISTTEGMRTIQTSPFLAQRLIHVPARIDQMINAFKKKDFSLLGKLIEEDCLDMHHVMQTQNPPLFYWNEMTKTIMEAVIEWRKSGLAVYFTIDAGPNVHLIFESKDEEAVMKRVNNMQGIETIIMNHAAPGTKIINRHLF